MVNKAGGTIIIAFLGVLIGILLLSGISDNINSQTAIQFEENETIDISAARGVGNEINESGTNTFAVTKYPGSSGVKNLTLTNPIVSNGTDEATENTDYLFAGENGTITFLNTTYWTATETNDTLVSFNYFDDEYIEQNIPRNLMPLIIIFGAIAVFLVSLNPVLKSKILKIIGR